MAEQSYEFPPIGVRRIGRVNWLGVWTLYKKEVLRFANVWLQTILAPVVNTLLFFTIFSLAIGTGRAPVHGVPFDQFLAPGLIMMSVLQNSFANTSSSVLISKVQGNIVDSLMPPLSPSELTFAYALGGATRGVVVALATGIVLTFLVDMTPHNLLVVVVFAFLSGLLLSLIGMAAGIWADKFDHMAAVTNFIIMPMTFLSGTFYSVERMPELLQTISTYNPFFYMIDGFRAGFIGAADTSIMTGLLVLIGLNSLMWTLCYKLFKSGWRLKA
ncbi:MAG: ABC transporter permease [Alphaproteobacteria bacterium]